MERFEPASVSEASEINWWRDEDSDGLRWTANDLVASENEDDGYELEVWIEVMNREAAENWNWFVAGNTSGAWIWRISMSEQDAGFGDATMESGSASGPEEAVLAAVTTLRSMQA